VRKDRTQNSLRAKGSENRSCLEPLFYLSSIFRAQILDFIFTTYEINGIAMLLNFKNIHVSYNLKDVE